MNKCKYLKLQRFVSYDNGHSWEALAEYKKSEEPIEVDSPDCYVCPVMYEFRVVENDYICVGSDKHQKLQKYESYDCGYIYAPTIPSEFQLGIVIESGSADCGYVTREITTATTCVGVDKYWLTEYQVSYDSGVTWTTTGSSATTLIERDSEDCGYTPPEAQYREITTATTCVGADKYWLTEYQVSYDSGVTWETTGTSATTLIERNSEDCGYITREITTSTTCVGADKYWLTEYQVSYDSGTTWTTTGTSATTLIEANSVDCGYATREVTTSTTCVGADKYWLTEYQVSYDSGATWETTGTSATTLIEENSEECGYRERWIMTTDTICVEDPSYKLLITNSDGTTKNAIKCNDNSTLSSGETRNLNSNMVSAVISDCVTAIGDGAFQSCSNLSSVTIPNTVTTIGTRAFGNCGSLSSITIPDSVTTIGQNAFTNSSNLSTVTCNAITPPTLVNGNAFTYTNIREIYVPCGSVDAYKSASGWSNYSSRINCDFEELDYIERNASYSGYIPSIGVTLESNTVFEIQFKPTNNGGGMILGETNAPSDNDDYRIFFYQNSMYYDYSSKRINKSMSLNTIYTFQVGNYYVRSGSTFSSNVMSSTTQSSSVATAHTRTIGLFDANSQDYALIYYLKVYEGDTLVKDFIPVRNVTDGTVTLLDRLTNEPLVVNGTFKGSDET